MDLATSACALALRLGAAILPLGLVLSSSAAGAQTSEDWLQHQAREEALELRADAVRAQHELARMRGEPRARLPPPEVPGLDVDIVAAQQVERGQLERIDQVRARIVELERQAQLDPRDLPILEAVPPS